jgi:hypothetical protein
VLSFRSSLESIARAYTSCHRPTTNIHPNSNTTTIELENEHLKKYIDLVVPSDKVVLGNLLIRISTYVTATYGNSLYDIAASSRPTPDVCGKGQRGHVLLLVGITGYYRGLSDNLYDPFTLYLRSFFAWRIAGTA